MVLKYASKSSVPITKGAKTASQTVTRVINENGASEKENINFFTHQKFFAKLGYEVTPPMRSFRSYSTPVCRNPSHARMPRKSRSRSGMALNASTTLRSNNEKSPASNGISR